MSAAAKLAVEPKERPILFSAPMVRAILEGRKTQTRRVVKFEHANDVDAWAWAGDHWDAGVCEAGSTATMAQILCPYGQPGDRLWVRETWAAVECTEDHPRKFWGPDHGWYVEDNSPREQWLRLEYSASAPRRTGQYGMAMLSDGSLYEGPWRPSIHMPRWASRITLEVTGVRIERLQDISNEDAWAEGCHAFPDGPSGKESSYWGCDIGGPVVLADTPREEFQGLWDSIHGDGAWDLNPWVWVVEFRRLTP